MIRVSTEHEGRKILFQMDLSSSSSLLQQVERDFASQRDESARERIQLLALDVALDWETKSEIFRLGLERIGWWEAQFAVKLPVTSG